MRMQMHLQKPLQAAPSQQSPSLAAKMLRLRSQRRQIRMIEHESVKQEALKANGDIFKPYHWTENYYITSRYFSELLTFDLM